jgi:IS30 family transposase
MLVKSNINTNPNGMPHVQLKLKDRIVIEKLLDSSKSQKEIAEVLNRSKSTISREIKRNRDKYGKYKAVKAKGKLKKRRLKSNQKFSKLSSKGSVRQFVIRKLKKYWSPEQIVGVLVFKCGKQILCHETIYSFIYNKRPDLKKYLRAKKGKYRLRHGSAQRIRAREEAKKQRIDTRPTEVDQKSRIGDWEGDTVRGGDKQSALLTHVERKSGYLLADRLDRAFAELTRIITVNSFSKIPKSKKYTITYDNGSEFAEHETTARDTKLDIYFAYPYHSWERGANENANGLLRQFFPKGTDFTEITDFELQNAVNLINTRPRKRLGYLTPKQVFSNSVAFRSRI